MEPAPNTWRYLGRQTAIALPFLATGAIILGLARGGDWIIVLVTALLGGGLLLFGGVVLALAINRVRARPPAPPRPKTEASPVNAPGGASPTAPPPGTPAADFTPLRKKLSMRRPED